MPNHAWLFCRLALAACLGSLAIGAPSIGNEQDEVRFVAPRIPPSDSSLDQILVQTSLLEREHRWSEALQVYAEGLRTHPDNAVLRQRQLQAQLHYDVNRRYRDPSYRSLIHDTNTTGALAVYAEVLNKIHTYHVNPPRWDRIAEMGVESLSVALNDAYFRELNIPQATDLQIATACQVVRETLTNFPVSTQQDAFVIASSLARQLEDRLNLVTSATVYEVIFGTMVALDPYSSFMTETQFNETMSQIEGNFVGLGVELKTLPQVLEIASVIAGGPAGNAGLQAGDRILAVDNQRTEVVGSETAADLLRGPENSSVALVIQRGDKVYQATIQRRQVDIPSISEARILDSGIGYIRISSFQKTTPRDFDRALTQLNQFGLESLIIDVRDNPGGLLSAAVDIADRFVQSGVIVSTKGRNPVEDFVHRAVANGTWSVPLVVLVDGNSASASEIFAAAIADHKRGRIVGVRSYGKGSVQGIFPLSVSGGGIRLTTAKFYGPDGEAIQDNGVQPDVIVRIAAKPGPADGESASTPADEILDMGVRIARQAISR